MAWIIGLVTDDELNKLRELGWEDSEPPSEMLSEDELQGVSDMSTRAFFVDSDVCTIMTGPGWDQPKGRL